MNSGLVYDSFLCDHMEEGHPECPERITHVYKMLVETGMINKMANIKSRDCTDNELRLCHSDEYIAKCNLMLRGDNNMIKKFCKQYNSVYANSMTLDVAKRAVGCCAELAEAVASGTLKNGIAVVRPPGHHAHVSKAGGFCIFNNVAIAAKKCLQYVNKVAIVDFDIHHGDGTQDVVRKRFNPANALFVSVHRYDNGTYFPGTGGSISDSNILNIPLNTTGTDQLYLNLFDNMIVPKLNEFKPDIILVSAGFDAADGDPLGGYKLTPRCYKDMMDRLKAVTQKIVVVVEGGYNLVCMEKCAEQVVRSLLS